MVYRYDYYFWASHAFFQIWLRFDTITWATFGGRCFEDHGSCGFKTAAEARRKWQWPLGWTNSAPLPNRNWGLVKRSTSEFLSHPQGLSLKTMMCSSAWTQTYRWEWWTQTEARTRPVPQVRGWHPLLCMKADKGHLYAMWNSQTTNLNHLSLNHVHNSEQFVLKPCSQLWTICSLSIATTLGYMYVSVTPVHKPQPSV